MERGRSDLDLFRDDQSVVNIDAQVSHRALYLGVSKQKLNGAQIAGAAVDHGCLCPPQRVRAVDVRVESDPDQPFRQQARVLSGGHALVTPTSVEQVLARLLVGCR